MKKTIIFLAILVSISFCGHTVFAVKRAVFPDPKSLQPAPQGINANISGNINSTTSVSPTMPIEKETSNTNGISDTGTEETQTRSLSFYIALFSGGLLMICLAAYLVKKLRNSVS